MALPSSSSASSSMPPPPCAPGDAPRATLRPFVKYLVDLLSNPSNRGVIEWTPEGDAFTIANRERFVEVWNAGRSNEIGSLAAVTRQLNTYGFRKRGGDQWANEHFHRDHPERYALIAPNAASSASKKRKADEAAAPLPPGAHAPAALPMPGSAQAVAVDQLMLSSMDPAATAAAKAQLQRVMAVQQQLAAQQQQLALHQAQVAERVRRTGQTMQKMEAMLMQRQAALDQFTAATPSPMVIKNSASAAGSTLLGDPALEAPALVRSPSAMSAISHVSGTSNLTNLFDSHPEIFGGLPPALSRSVAGDSFNLEEVLTQPTAEMHERGQLQGVAGSTEAEEEEHISASQPDITTVD